MHSYWDQTWIAIIVLHWMSSGLGGAGGLVKRRRTRAIQAVLACAQGVKPSEEPPSGWSDSLVSFSLSVKTSSKSS